MALDENIAAPNSEGRGADLSPPPTTKLDKGKGKAKEVEKEVEEDEDEEDEEDEDFEDEHDEEDDDLDQDLEDLINDVDPSDIVPVTRQRSARSKPIDYSSAEAMQKAGLEGDNGAVAANYGGARPSEEDEDDADFKGDETMEDDF